MEKNKKNLTKDKQEKKVKNIIYFKINIMNKTLLF